MLTMTDLENLKKQILAIDPKNRGHLDSKELKELPTILKDDEQIEKLIRVQLKVQMGGNLGEKGESGLLFATNKRLIFLKKGIFGSRREDFFYHKISSIQFKAGMLTGDMIIIVSANETKITSVQKKELEIFSNYVREKISEENNPIEQKTQTFYHYGDVVGTQIQDSLLIRSNIGTTTPMCTNCGDAIKEGQKFCSNCGKEIINTSSISTSSNGDYNNKADETMMDLMEIRKYLIKFARKNRMITYKKFKDDFGLEYAVQTFNLLKQISRNCIERGEPLLSAIVVNTDGLPGKGFFDDATKNYLGYHGPATGPEAKQVHQHELEKISNWNWE